MGTVECTATSAIRVVATNVDSEQYDREHADVHLAAVDHNQGPLAECSLWWSEVPALQNHRLGTIGHYQAECDSAAQMLLATACDRLRRAGCTCAIGPMDGNPWRRYRFVTDAGTEPAFFLEPQNPPQWPQQFMTAGFTPLASYISSLNPDLSRQDVRSSKARDRLRSLGVVLRSLRDREELEGYLPRIYQVCCVAFRKNYLYTDLSEEDFLRQHKKLLHALRPKLLIVAEQQSETVGFLFAVPDLLRETHGLPLDTFIIKTVAILPRRELSGLGAVLVGEAQQLGAQMGFRRCIHALMQAGNMLARNISDAYARPMRTYTLYAKDLRT
jgi:GNAT superfamily N-acetyltransferase